MDSVTVTLDASVSACFPLDSDSLLLVAFDADALAELTELDELDVLDMHLLTHFHLQFTNITVLLICTLKVLFVASHASLLGEICMAILILFTLCPVNRTVLSAILLFLLLQSVYHKQIYKKTCSSNFNSSTSHMVKKLPVICFPISPFVISRNVEAYFCVSSINVEL